MKWLKYLSIPALAVVVVLLTADTQGQSGNGDLVVNLDSAVFPRTQIIKFNNRITRFDTATGALFRFRGTQSGGSAHGNFVNIASPVNDTTSGFLQIQQVANATFLVDVINGDTWILRAASNTNADWVAVDTVGD